MDPETGGIQETLIVVEFTRSAVKLVGESAPVIVNTLLSSSLLGLVWLNFKTVYNIGSGTGRGGHWGHMPPQNVTVAGTLFKC